MGTVRIICAEGQMMLKNAVTLAAFLWVSLTACAKEMKDADLGNFELAKIGESYEVVRNRLLANGWTPEIVDCSERMVCTEFSELATNLNNSSTCARFRSAHRELRLCVDSVSDGFRVSELNLKE